MTATVASFDVFDTLLTRRVGEPTSLFWFVASALDRAGIAVDPGRFVAERIAAQRACRERHADRETTLEEITRELAARLGLEPAAAATLANTEMTVESDLICAVPGAARRVAAARQFSGRILFISDMYLPAEFIRTQLEKFDCWQAGDQLYVSNEHRRSKPDGGLFRAVLAAEGVKPADVVHAGNHREHDIGSAARLGMHTEFLPAGNLTRYEQLIETHGRATRGFASVLAGSARLARLAADPKPGRGTALCEVAAGVAGPVLVSYVRWVLRTARGRGIRRLYFVARDGFLLLEVARLLAPKEYPTAELRYLYGSRQAWHLPGIFALGESELSWLFCPTDPLTIDLVFARVEVPASAHTGTLAAAGFPESTWRRNLSPDERRRLRDLMRSPEITASVVTQAARARENAAAYLAQEGLFDGVASALVDLGWHGRAQDSLEKILHSQGAGPVVGFYFGLNAPSSTGNAASRVAWFFDRRTPATATHAFPGIEALLETLCTAGHGTTSGYVRRGPRVEPMLRPAPASLEAWGWPLVEQTVVAFAAAFAHMDALEVGDDALRTLCRDVLREFWERPTDLEAAAWGAFPYEDDQSGAHVRPLAEALPWSQVGQILLHGRNGPHRASWWAGSRRLTPTFTRAAVSAAFHTRALGRRLLGRPS